VAGQGGGGAREPLPEPERARSSTGWPPGTELPHLAGGPSGGGVPRPALRPAPGPIRADPRRRTRRAGSPVFVPSRTPYLPVFDVVTFVAACPACSADCTWVQERDDTRVSTRIECPCPAPGAVRD
jgi:hypothetical protein